MSVVVRFLFELSSTISEKVLFWNMLSKLSSYRFLVIDPVARGCFYLSWRVEVREAEAMPVVLLGLSKGRKRRVFISVFTILIN